jgi:hypothetical protein
MDFFLYARWLSTDSNSLLLPFFLAISEKQQEKKGRSVKNGKIFYRNVFFFSVETMVRVEIFSSARLCVLLISWGRFTFNIWITQRVVVERGWNKRRYI